MDTTWARKAQDRALWNRAVAQVDLQPLSRSADARPTARSVRAKPSSQPNDLRCTLCPFVAKNKQGLSRHVNEKHPVSKPVWKCEACGREFNARGTLKKHKCEARAEDPPPVVARNFQCSFAGCDASFLNVSQKNRHERTQCLARPGSGAVRQPDGRFALMCTCGIDTPFFSTRALAIHKTRTPH